MITSIDEAVQAVDLVLNSPTARMPFPGKERPVLIYGAGHRGTQVFETLLAEGYNVVGFMDRGFSAIGTHLGRPAYPVCSAEELGLDGDPPHVLVAIFRHDIDISNLFQTLPELGFPGVSSFQELVEQFPGAFDMVLWQGGRTLLTQAREELAKVLTLLADDTSQQVFLECLQLRCGNPLAMQQPDRHHQYFPPDLLPCDRGLRLVDCGAYDGDTFANILDQGIELEAFLALEPDPTNFAKLAARMRAMTQGPREIALVPCAAWNCTTTLRFGAGSEQNSQVDSEGASFVQAVRLDDVLAGFPTTWLKLDIEGAEMEALMGARGVLERDHPFLAVAAYHFPDHLWKLPLTLHSWNLGYEFFLRPHGYAGVDMVLYARKAS